MDYAGNVNKIIITVVLILAPPLQAADVYKTVDEQGNIIFSDKPSPNSEMIEVQEPFIVPSLQDYQPGEEASIPTERYNEVVITGPKHDETYFRSEGDLVVSVALKPSLSRNDFIVLYLDGKEYQSGRATSFSLPELDRGTHEVSIAIRDRAGTIIKKSEPVTFHMRQNTVQKP